MDAWIRVVGNGVGFVGIVCFLFILCGYAVVLLTLVAVRLRRVLAS